MKWKVIIALFVIAIGGLVSTVKYYGFEWNVLANLTFYENLANPSIKIIRIQEGLRKEEVSKVIGDKLGWNTTQKQEFENAHLALGKTNVEGYLFPKTYMILKTNSPKEVSKTITDEFKTQTSTIKKAKQTKIINEETAIKIASIIQKEAGHKSDMKLISGIIWNRIFKGMKLEMDVTLQYAKGSEAGGWWPEIEPEDKKIDSPYNTYMYFSLPPYPIASPGLTAIEAAYNPQKTTCIFFLHDKKGKMHCSATYEEHKRNIQRYY